MKQDKKSSVSYKSPKNEIWAAYKKLKKQKPSPTPTPALRPKLDWRQQLLSSIKKFDDQLQTKQEELTSLEEQIEKAQKDLEKAHQIKIKAQTLNELEERIEALEKLWSRKQKQLEEDFEEEKAWQEKKLNKENEEKRFILEMKRRQLEQEISEKEKDWQKKEKEYQKLKEESETFPKTLEQEIQIKMLNGQLSSTHQKMKELAVAALEAKRPKIIKRYPPQKPA